MGNNISYQPINEINSCLICWENIDNPQFCKYKYFGYFHLLLLVIL